MELLVAKLMDFPALRRSESAFFTPSIWRQSKTAATARGVSYGLWSAEKKGITNHVLFHLGGNGGETILLKWIEHWAQNNVYLQHSTVRFGQHSSILAKVIWNAKVHESRPHNMQRGLSMPWNVSISPMCGFEPALKRIKLDNTHDSMIDQWCMSSSVTSRIDHMRIHSCPYVWYFCNYILWFIAFHMSDIWYFCTYCNMMHEYNI